MAQIREGAKALLSTLKLNKLKQLAYLVGLNSSGTKTQLHTVIQHKIEANFSGPAWQGGRLVSVDMGIRNLAYCVLDVTLPRPADGQIGRARAPGKIYVQAWKRRDLVSGLKTAQSPQLTQAGDVTNNLAKKKHVEDKIPADAFTPSSLSKVAYNTASELLDCEPNTILIERQRWRSSSAPSIQEWTLRVNMLESMLWACFETLQRSSEPSAGFPQVLEVSPSRVVGFCLSGPSTDITTCETMDQLLEGAEAHPSPIRAESKVSDKKVRIGIVRELLSSGSFEGNALVMSNETARVAETFKNSGKLDDLADCLLQGITWAKWQANIRHLVNLLEKSIGN